MTRPRRRTAKILGALIILSGLTYLGLMQFAFVDHGQEFGAYGQYHRVLRVIHGMDDYRILSHGVSRKLEWDQLHQVESFTFKLRNKTGQIADVRFEKETDAMREKDPAALQAIVRLKFADAASVSTRSP